MKRALVTGGSGIIGAAICEGLAAEGMHVVVHSHNHPDRAKRVVEKIISKEQSAESVCFDVTDRKDSLEKIEILLQDGPIQVLINNAGINEDAPLAGMSPDQWSRVIEVTLTGFYNVTQPLLLPMIRTRWGRIINISSLTGVAGRRGQTNYAAAKAGLHGASKSLALEVASRGITVNVIAPGVIQSPLTDEFFTDDFVDTMIPLKRRGTAEDIAQATRFFASDKASYISGQILNVNGGMY